MNVVIIKYNAGNVRSVTFALERLGVNATLTDDPDTIRKADRVIFPGVGEAGSTMRYLRERNLDQLITGLKQPFLGICLGMQLMCRHSEENDTECLGIFDEPVKKFDAAQGFKIPHMGWNNLHKVSGWLDQSLEGQYVYFVHSYYVPVNPYTVATTDYVVPFSAAIRKDNFYAVQFHPEKSADAGVMVLKSFLEDGL